MLILAVFFNLTLDAIYKHNRFIKTWLEENLKFVLYKRNNAILFNLNFTFLLKKVDLILEKQGQKKDILVTYSIDYIKSIFALLTKVVALYIYKLL